MSIDQQRRIQARRLRWGTVLWWMALVLSLVALLGLHTLIQL